MNSNNNRSKRQIENELQEMRRQIGQLSTKNSTMRVALEGKAKSEEIGSNLLMLFKHVTKELDSISERLDKIDATINADYYEQEDQEPYQQENNRLVKVQPGQQLSELALSELDLQILQIVQTSKRELACADDIRRQMNYKGRNAASARLNKLFRMRLLQRYQLGHKVYYKFDAGKTTTTLIISPPQ